MAAAAAAAELLAGDRQDLDARLGELGVGGLVALVGDDGPGRQRDDVVPVVPLVSLGLELVTAGGDERQVGEPERVLDLVDERSVGDLAAHAAVAVRRVQDRDDLRHDGLIERRDVAVAEREHRVEMHRRAVAGHVAADHEARRSGREQVLGEDAHRARVRALALADEDDAVADGHDVAALQRGAAPVVVDAAEPDLEGAIAEARMEPVDRLEVQRLVLAGGPVHRVDRHAAVDPRARVAHEQLVGKRVQDEVGRPQRPSDRGDDVGRELGQRHAARQARCQLLGRHLGHPRRQLAGEDRGDLLRAQLALQHPLARGRIRERLGQQLVEQQHLDAALAHHVDERVELLPRAAHPDDVVEQQLVAVRGGQSLVGEVGAVDDHAAERADLRSDAKFGGGGWCCHGYSSLSSGRPRRRRTRSRPRKRLR